MEYQVVTISTESNNVDIVYNVINDLGIQGVVINDSQIKDEFIAHDESVLVDWNQLDILKSGAEITFYQDEENPQIKIDELKSHLDNLKIVYQIKLGTQKEENWDQYWKPYYHSLQLSKDIAIKPSWEEIPIEFSNLKVIEMDPKMAFGSGTHQTSRLSVRALNDLDLVNKDLLDIGTGSGILAIAASLLGAKNIFATDIDTNSVNIARENMLANGIENPTVVVSDLLSEVPMRTFNVITANLLLPIHQRLLPEISSYLAEDSKLIISGITIHQFDQINELLEENNLKINTKYQEDDWLALTLSKNE